jgi:uncharacterized protein YegL
MPANRVTSLSPWHVVLVLDDSGSMAGQPANDLNDGLKAMIAEFEVIAKGTKPYFKVSIVSFGSTAREILVAQGERDVDVQSLATFAGNSGSTNAADGLRAACSILKRNPGQASDFRPYVFFFSDGAPDSEQDALEAASELKALQIAAGTPTVVSIGLGSVNDKFMKAVATNPELYLHLQNSNQLVKLFPQIGTIAGTKTGGEAQINQAIINL